MYVEGNPVNYVDPSGETPYNRMAAAAYAIVHMSDGKDLISRLRDAGYSQFKYLPRQNNPVDKVIP